MSAGTPTKIAEQEDEMIGALLRKREISVTPFHKGKVNTFLSKLRETEKWHRDQAKQKAFTFSAIFGAENPLKIMFDIGGGVPEKDHNGVYMFDNFDTKVSELYDKFPGKAHLTASITHPRFPSFFFRLALNVSYVITCTPDCVEFDQEVATAAVSYHGEYPGSMLLTAGRVMCYFRSEHNWFMDYVDRQSGLIDHDIRAQIGKIEKSSSLRKQPWFDWIQEKRKNELVQINKRKRPP